MTARSSCGCPYTHSVSIRVQPEIAPSNMGGVPRGRPLARWSLTVCTFLLLATAIVVGNHPSSWDHLLVGLDTGRVRTVWVRGGLPPGASGSSPVVVRWHEGLIWREAQVLEVKGVPARHGAARVERTSTVVRGDVGARLVQLRPDVHLIRQQEPSGVSGTVLGWGVPAWMGLATLALWMAGVMLLMLHAKPWWRATRWAWFWLMMIMPLGTLAFLVLAGPTPFVPAPRNPARRLTGGWALLLTLLLGAVFFG
jgi:hypothetical protein